MAICARRAAQRGATRSSRGSPTISSIPCAASRRCGCSEEAASRPAASTPRASDSARPWGRTSRSTAPMPATARFATRPASSACRTSSTSGIRCCSSASTAWSCSRTDASRRMAPPASSLAATSASPGSSPSTAASRRSHGILRTGGGAGGRIFASRRRGGCAEPSARAGTPRHPPFENEEGASETPMVPKAPSFFGDARIPPAGPVAGDQPPRYALRTSSSWSSSSPVPDRVTRPVSMT